MNRRFAIALGLVLAACTGRPDRDPLTDYQSVADGPVVAPIPNDCDTRAFAFNVIAEGYYEGRLKGFATYEYKSVPDQRTSITLNVCNGDTERVMTLNYYGIQRVQKGEHDVSRLAQENTGFEFSFVDEAGDTGMLPLRCDDSPTGTVFIERSTYARLEGTFDIVSHCIDQEIIDETRRPQETRFQGRFAANNIGTE